MPGNATHHKREDQNEHDAQRAARALKGKAQAGVPASVSLWLFHDVKAFLSQRIEPAPDGNQTSRLFRNYKALQGTRDFGRGLVAVVGLFGQHLVDDSSQLS